MSKEYLDLKRAVANKYQEWGNLNGFQFVKEPKNTRSNYWLNLVITQNKQQRNAMLEFTNGNNVMTRPIWIPMHKLAINNDCQKNSMENTEWLSERLVNVPSSVVSNDIQ